MVLSYTEDNGEVITIDTDKATLEELKNFAFNDIYNFTCDTLCELEPTKQKRFFNCGCIPNDYAIDKYSKCMPLDVINSIVDEVIFNLSDEVEE